MMPNFGIPSYFSGMPTYVDTRSMNVGFGVGYDSSASFMPQFMPDFGAMAGMMDPTMMSGMMDPTMMSGMMDPTMMSGMMDPSMMSGMVDPTMMSGMTQPPMMTPGMTDPSMMGSSAFNAAMMASMMPSSLTTIANSGDNAAAYQAQVNAQVTGALTGISPAMTMSGPTSDALFLSQINSTVNNAMAGVDAAMKAAQAMQQPPGSDNNPPPDNSNMSANQQKLVDKAKAEYGGKTPQGLCAAGVQNIVSDAFGINIRGTGNAKDMGSGLLAHGFTDVTSQYSSPSQVPAGYVIVYQPGAGGWADPTYGHVQVTTGGGQAISDGQDKGGVIGNAPPGSFSVYAPTNPH